ncbi:MOB kinase activator-like 1A [Sorghum bicolor]|nr:MOB kinase activator-like 1A [Sorghum bicolor]|eukprot:XP_002443916.2 MOB kinase activator-like 1A [Sorghum bicolor]
MPARPAPSAVRRLHPTAVPPRRPMPSEPNHFTSSGARRSQTQLGPPFVLFGSSSQSLAACAKSSSSRRRRRRSSSRRRLHSPPPLLGGAPDRGRAVGGGGGMSLFGLGRNQKTFRPKKSAPSGSKGAQLRKHIDATLGSGNLREAVRLPPGEDINEWLAVNTVDFFNQVNLLYGTLTEFCTPESCPTMTAGPKYEYRWADGVQIKKPIEVSAPKYVEYLMDWIEGQLDDESIFPQKLGTPFPQNFKEVVKTIFKRLFRVYAHIYHSHFQKIVSLKEEAHLNTCFKHFILFTNEFGLIDKKELAPLQELIESIIVPY